MKFSWTLRLVSWWQSHNTGSSCLLQMPPAAQSQVKLRLNSEGSVIFVTQLIFLLCSHRNIDGTREGQCWAEPTAKASVRLLFSVANTADFGETKI